MISERTDSAAIARAIGALLRAEDEIARALALVRALDPRAVAGADAPAPAPDHAPPAAPPGADAPASARVDDHGDDDDDAPAIAVLPADRAPTHPPCPDVETWRRHVNFHRQQPDGSWTCAACAALRPAAPAPPAPGATIEGGARRA